MLKRVVIFRRQRLHRLSGLGLLVVAICCGALPASRAAETIALATHGGRIFVGQVDAKSNAQSLWLRSENAGITLRRPIAWQVVALARHGEQELNAAQLLAKVDELKSVAKVTAEELPVPGETARETLPAPREWVPDLRAANFIAANRAANAQVCSIGIDAYVANWNRTVEADGIMLHLYPLDAAGNTIACDATLDVDLVASVSPGARRGTPLPNIGHWSMRVTPGQFGPNGFVVKLPFQSVQPEFDLDFGPLGLVHARLSVPGNGAFETSQAMVRIRPYSAVRDRSQQINGQRFMDVERVDKR